VGRGDTSESGGGNKNDGKFRKRGGKTRTTSDGNLKEERGERVREREGKIANKVCGNWGSSGRREKKKTKKKFNFDGSKRREKELVEMKSSRGVLERRSAKKNVGAFRG